MPLYLDSFNNNLPERFNSSVQIKGVDSLCRDLEKYFFSRVITRTGRPQASTTNLVIELHCNMSLVEVLFHFTKDNWGNFGDGQSSLTQMMKDLMLQNKITLDIGEISLFFKDTTIVISKIYDNSIPEQLNTILTEIGKNYVHFSKGLAEVPYEIYVPVFEDSKDQNIAVINNIKVANNSKKDYYKYWALYFDSEEDAIIYNLEKSCLENGDLFMLNQ